jgi:hypothetical protein
VRSLRMGNVPSWETLVSAAFCGHVRPNKRVVDAETQCDPCEDTATLQRTVDDLLVERATLQSTVAKLNGDMTCLESALGRWRGGSSSNLQHLSGPASRPASPVMGVPAIVLKPDLPPRVGLAELHANRGWRR